MTNALACYVQLNVNLFSLLTSFKGEDERNERGKNQLLNGQCIFRGIY